FGCQLRHKIAKISAKCNNPTFHGANIKKKFQDVETFVCELHDGRHWITETEYVVQQYGTSGVVCGGDNVS
ncbi:MAG: hypothetical protein J6U88_05565, partial [Bacteroidales bacterium]|nr:hypothetical protein [Bacteroidales bacterium]